MAREMREVGAVRSRRRGNATQWRIEFRRQGEQRAKARVYAWPDAPGSKRRPFKSAKDAREALALIRAELARGKPLAVVLEAWSARTAPESLLLARAERWLARVQEQVDAEERSPTYLRELRRYVTHPGYWAKWWEGREVHGITYAELEDWSGWLSREGGDEGKGIGPKTRRHCLHSFRTFLRWLKRREEIEAVPDFPTVEVDEHAPTIIDVKTQERVLAEIPWERRGLFLACRLAVRPSEATAMHLDAFTVDADGRPWLVVAHAMKGPYSDAPRRGAKERRVRRIPLDAEAAEWIRWRLEQRAEAMKNGKPAWALSLALFPNPTGRRSQHRWLGKAPRQEWARALKRAGVGVHVALYEGTKHSFATDAVARGVPLEWVQKFLGHADRRSTELYVRFGGEGLVSVLRSDH